MRTLILFAGMNVVMPVSSCGASSATPNPSLACDYAVGEVWDGAQCTVPDITSNDQGVADAAYAEGVSSVDITTDNQTAFDDGVASVNVPDGDTFCDEDSTDWDLVAQACVSSVEEAPNCFQSAYCLAADNYWSTRLPVSQSGPTTQAEGEAVTNPDVHVAVDTGAAAANHSPGGMLLMHI